MQKRSGHLACLLALVEVKMSVAKASVAKTLEAISGESKKTFRSSKNQIGLVLFHLYAEGLVYIDTT